jgi:hypothetical protein
MFRKVTVALLAIAALGMLAPDVVSARGGGGGGHGGFGGFHGGFGHGGFHVARFSGRGFHAARFGHRRAEFRFEHFRHTSPNEKHMTSSRREVVHCLTSDCRIWHGYRD